MRSLSFGVFVLAVLAMCGLGQSASAGAGDEAASASSGLRIIVEHVRVRYSDLDLSTQEGGVVLLERINRAARDACGRMPERDSHYRTNASFVTRAFDQCRAAAMRTTVSRLALPMLSRAYADSNGGRQAAGQ